MKKYTLPATAAMLALSLTACAFSGEEMQSSAAAPAASSAPAAVQQAAPGSHKILIAYFAYGENAEIPDGADASASASIQPAADGMTGNTGLVARRSRNLREASCSPFVRRLRILHPMTPR